MTKIFLIDEQKKLKPLEEQPYESEDLLQELLAQYPDLLSDTEDTRWLLLDWMTMLTW